MFKTLIRHAHGNIGYGIRISSYSLCIYRHRSTSSSKTRQNKSSRIYSESLESGCGRGTHYYLNLSIFTDYIAILQNHPLFYLQICRFQYSSSWFNIYLHN